VREESAKLFYYGRILKPTPEVSRRVWYKPRWILLYNFKRMAS